MNLNMVCLPSGSANYYTTHYCAGFEFKWMDMHRSEYF